MAALRAFLASDAEDDEWVRRHNQLLQEGHADGYGQLLLAVFVTAVRRRFASPGTRAEVIRFVADLRRTLGEDHDAIDPHVAENLIRRALDDTVTDEEATPETRVRAQLLLLIALIEDEKLDAEGLEHVLSEARTMADRLSREQDPP